MPIATRGSPRRAAASPKRAAASPKRAAPKKSPSKAPSKSPKRARTPSRSAEPSYKKLAAELSAARDELSLTTQPLTTLRLFALALSDFAVSFLGSVALSKQALVVGYPLLALWVPFLLFAALAIWMYYVVAHVPGGQPIGALERVAAKAAQKIRGLMTLFQRKPRVVESLT